jgi:hypothetical protein
MLDNSNLANSNTKSWKKCFEPERPEKSVYPYCNNLFYSNKGDSKVKDYYQTSRCKVDMCNLCCASFDFTFKTKISKLNLERCYTGCATKFDLMPDKN